MKSAAGTEDSRFIVRKEESVPSVPESNLINTTLSDEGELINFDDIFSSAAIEPSKVSMIEKKKKRMRVSDTAAKDVLGDISEELNTKKEAKVGETIRAMTSVKAGITPVSVSAPAPASVAAAVSLGLSLKQQIGRAHV